MKIHLRIWRQKNSEAEGHFSEYDLDNVREDMSFLEMLDVLNEQLIDGGNEPVAFDSDCREGVCGMCSLVINGKAHAWPARRHNDLSALYASLSRWGCDHH